MSNLYPTLEDLKVHQYIQAQDASNISQSSQSSQTISGSGTTKSINILDRADLTDVYPSLMSEYMGLKLELPSVDLADGRLNIFSSTGQYQVQPVTQSSGPANAVSVIAPLSHDDIGMKRAQVSQCIREVFCCRNQNGKFGMRFKDINKGLFIQFVENGSPAAISGLRFGDQILQINGTNVAGFTCDQAFKLLSKIDAPQVSFVVRDRPFERTITLHKDSQGNVGFTHDDGLIKAIVKDSSAARNGLLIDHYILEINGQNVVSLKSKQTAEIIKNAGQMVTLTIMPKAVYEHMVNCMSENLLKKLMDRSVPEIY